MQQRLPQLQGGGLGRVGRAGGALFAVARIVLADQLAQKLGGAAADIALAVHQQLVQKVKGHGFLARVQIDGIFAENIQIGANAAPVLFGAGAFQQVGKAAVTRENGHNQNVLLHALKQQALHGLGHAAQRDIRHGRGGRGAAGKIHIHALGAHIILKIVQTGVHKFIAVQLGFVHIVQLGKDHPEGIVQSVNAGKLASVGIALLLNAEIGVDQAQSLHRKVVQLKIPCGMVGPYRADGGSADAAKPLVGVIIVQIGHTLAGAAAVFANVMPGGGSAGKGQIHRQPGGQKAARRRHGNMVNARNVPQRAKRGHFVAKAQHFIHIFLAPCVQKDPVFPGALKPGGLCLGKKLKIHQRVGLAVGALGIQTKLQNAQIQLCACLPGGGSGGKVGIGIQKMPGVFVAKGQPAALGLTRANLLQGLAAGFQHMGADNVRLGAQSHDRMVPVGRGYQRSAHRLRQRNLLREAAKQGLQCDMTARMAMCRHGKHSFV